MSCGRRVIGQVYGLTILRQLSRLTPHAKDNKWFLGFQQLVNPEEPQLWGYL
jgi:hypothetical protein